MPAPSYTETEKKVRSLNLSLIVLEALERVAKRERRSVSFVADEILAKALQLHDDELQPA